MKFLKDGNRVKVTVRFRGREMAHTNIGEQLLHASLARDAPKSPPWIKNPKLDGRFMTHVPVAQEQQNKSQYGRRTTMPKLKTHSGAKKRFNLTKTGKVKRAHAFKSHILTKKDTKRCPSSAQH